MDTNGKQRVCVIGGGAGGLAAGRHLIGSSHLFHVTIYEQTSQIGGTWVYTDQVGTDQHGLPIHTSMYKSLRTNLPKEIMGFPDFPIPEVPDGERSYLHSREILSFLEKYARHFGILDHIKFSHRVKLVEPVENEERKWRVIVEDLVNKTEAESFFDAVMVCNGHYHTPMYPEIQGLDTFKGCCLHSHDYRDPAPFTGLRVLVVGAGPSGIDLSLEIASTASKVILSRHKNTEEIKNVFPDNVEMKYEMSEIQGDAVVFEDGSKEEVDCIFLCTGYKYSFPFLSEKCGVRVVENCVQPLYKHLIHIDHPTLCLVGLPYYVCAFSLFDLQVRFFLKTLKGELRLDSAEEMRADTEDEMARRRERGLKTKQFHMMGELQGAHYDELAQLGALDPLPPVFASLHTFSSQRQLDHLASFREDVYRIIDISADHPNWRLEEEDLQHGDFGCREDKINALLRRM